MACDPSRFRLVTRYTSTVAVLPTPSAMKSPMELVLSPSASRNMYCAEAAWCPPDRARSSKTATRRDVLGIGTPCGKQCSGSSNMVVPRAQKGQHPPRADFAPHSCGRNSTARWRVSGEDGVQLLNGCGRVEISRYASLQPAVFMGR